MKTQTFLKRTPIPAPAAELFGWHCKPGAIERLMPPWEDARIVECAGTVETNGRLVLDVATPIGRKRWVAQMRDFEPGHRFFDDQVEGPFRRWTHTHSVESDGDGASFLEDRIDYVPPMGILGRIFASRMIRKKLERTFRWRHQRTLADMARHLSSPRDPLRVAITGASGLVGHELALFLQGGGHTVLRLVRGAAKSEGEVAWDPARGEIDAGELEGVDAVVHLAGENIGAHRWSEAHKKRVLQSRVDGTRVLCEAIGTLEKAPRVLVSGSAIGIYGDRGDEVLDEKSIPGDGFLADVCRAWEGATGPAVARGVRVVRLRTGMVLAQAGGALVKLLPIFRLGLGGPIGAGRAYMSWIGLDDLVGAIHFAITRDGLSGAVNAVAPEPIRNADFARTLGRTLHRWAFLPTPAAALRLILGKEMAQELLLSSQRVRPAALESAGFRFARPTLEETLRFELGLR